MDIAKGIFDGICLGSACKYSFEAKEDERDMLLLDTRFNLALVIYRLVDNLILQHDLSSKYRATCHTLRASIIILPTICCFKPVQWLHAHFDHLFEKALLVSSLALSIIYRSSPYALALGASTIVTIVNRFDWVPKPLQKGINSLERFSFISYLLSNRMLFRAVGQFGLLWEIEHLFLKALYPQSTQKKVSFEEFQKLDLKKLKLTPGHLSYTPQMGDLPNENLEDLKTLVTEEDWNNNISQLVLSLQSDRTWLEKGGDQFVKDYVKETLPSEKLANNETEALKQLYSFLVDNNASKIKKRKVIFDLCKDLPFDEILKNHQLENTPAFVGKMQWTTLEVDWTDFFDQDERLILDSVPNLTQYLAKEAKDHMIRFAKNNIRQIVTAAEKERLYQGDEKTSKQLKIKLSHVLKNLRDKDLNAKLSTLIQLAHDGGHCTDQIAESIERLYTEISEENSLETDLPFALEAYRKEQAEKKYYQSCFSKYRRIFMGIHTAQLHQKIFGVRYACTIDRMDPLCTALSILDDYYAIQDRKNKKRTFFSAREMRAEYEKNIVSITKDLIGKSKQVSHKKVQEWLENWGKRNGQNYQELFYDDDGNYKDEAIALMLTELGVVH